jgi:hypothetical protein
MPYQIHEVISLNFRKPSILAGAVWKMPLLGAFLTVGGDVASGCASPVRNQPAIQHRSRENS